MCNMPAEGIKIEKHFRKNLGQYYTDGFGSDGRVVTGLIKGEEKFVAVLEHSLSNYVAILIHLPTCQLPPSRSNIW